MTVCRDDTGNIQGTMAVFGATQQARSSFDDESKKLTAATRKEGACTKCRSGKKRVSLFYVLVTAMG